MKRGGNIGRRTPLRNRPTADKPPKVRAQLDAALVELRRRAAAVGQVDVSPSKAGEADHKSARRKASTQVDDSPLVAQVMARDALVLPAADLVPVDPLSLPALPRPRARRITSPTYLRLVRMMPCSLPDCPSLSRAPTPPQRPWYEALQVGRAQCDPNHHPGRGASGGGSDLETHPLCRPCHERVTLHKVPREVLDRLVGETLRQVVQALRAGRLPLDVLGQIAAEVLAG